jgi:O-antigen/teichoic acid export membrane protein
VPTEPPPSAAEDADPIVERLSGSGGGSRAGAFAWTTGSNIVQQVIRFISSIVLARILVPSDYGLIAVVSSVTLFGSMFADLGLASAIIHTKLPSGSFLSTAFWINAVAGVALALSAGGAGYLLALIYSEPQLRHLMWIAGLTFALDLTVVHTALMERALRFRQLALIESSATLIAIAASIVGAAEGMGATSLVFGPVVGTVFTTIVTWIAVPWRPALSLTRGAAAASFAYSRGLIGFNIVNYWARNADNLLLARVTSARQLGLYNRSYSLMMAPITQMTTVFGRVLFPMLARMRNDAQALGRFWLRTTKIAILVTLPAALTCATAAPALIAALYGPRWHGAAPILELLGLAAAIQMFPASAGQVYLAMGATDELFRRGVRVSICTVIAIAAGLPWGAVGVAAGVLTNSWLIFWYPVAGACELTQITLMEALMSMRGLFLSGIGFTAGSVALCILLTSQVSNAVLVIAQAAAGTAVMILLIAVLDRALFREATGYAGRALRRTVRHRPDIS